MYVVNCMRAVWVLRRKHEETCFDEIPFAMISTAGRSSIPNRMRRTFHVTAQPTRRKQRGGRRPQTEFLGRCMRQRFHAPKKTSRASIQAECSGFSWYQRCHVPKTTTRSSIPNKILGTLHTPAPKNSGKVMDSKQNSQDAPRASTPTRRKQRQGRRFQSDFADCSTCQRCHAFQTEFAGRSTRQGCHAPRTTRKVIDSKQNSQIAPHASAPTR